MKVLMTADAVGGVWTYALDLSAALRDHDVTVVLAAMGPRPSDAQRRAVQRLDNVQLVESDYRLEWMADPWQDVAAAGEWLLGVAFSHAVDVVHLNGYSHASLPWRRPVVCVAHSCVSSWWQAVRGTLPPAEWHTYRCNVASGLNSADCVVAPTQAFLDQLRTCYEFDKPAKIIRNARAPLPLEVRNSAKLLPIGLAPATSGLDGCQNDERLPIVLACGRPWDVSKNMGVLDTAARGLPWCVYAIGSTLGPDGQSFTPASLRCLGTLPADDVAMWLRRASVFVHPALYEPFGLAVLEAAASGCALVLADIPSLRELWDGAAEYFDPRDSEQLRTALESLIRQPDRRRSLSIAALERASQYRLDAMGAEYARIYETLAASRNSGKRAVA